MTTAVKMPLFEALRRRLTRLLRLAILLVALASFSLMASACNGGQYVRHVHRRGVSSSQRQFTPAEQKHAAALSLKCSHCR